MKLGSVPPRSLDSPLRWVGSKRHLKATLGGIRASLGGVRVIDPFVGGCSALLALGPGDFVGGDMNAELVEFLGACVRGSSDVWQEVCVWEDSREEYERVKALVTPPGSVIAAARFLYLNRCSYMGLYRMNRRGEFNVPYGGGGRLHVSLMQERLKALGERLGEGTLVMRSFEETLSFAEDGDLVFLDPPYARTGVPGFNRYSADGFDVSSHRSLAALACSLSRSCTVVVTIHPGDGGPDDPWLKVLSTWTRLKVAPSERLRNGELLLSSRPLGGVDGRGHYLGPR